MSKDEQSTNQGNQTNNKPQSYGTEVCKKSLNDVSKPISYGTQVITEDANSKNK